MTRRSIAAIVTVFTIVACADPIEPDEGALDQAIGSGSGSGNDAGVDADYSSYFVPGPDLPWVFDPGGESLEAAGYTGPVPNPFLASIPRLKNTTQLCTEFASAPTEVPFPKASCTSNADIDCNWVAICAYVYQDMNGCDGNCFSQSTAKIARKFGALTNSATGSLWWRMTVCTAQVESGAGKIACTIHFKPLVCGDYWPAPTPTTTCK